MERVENRILSLRGHRVMLDADLAELYGVPTKRLNEAVRRNAARFPEDFMFQLTADEAETLRSQFATSKGRGGRRYIPYVFTELGVAMLSSVLNSERAVQVNIAMMRAFVRLRELAASHKDVLRRLDEMEGKYDRQFKVVFDAIRALMEPPAKPRRRIGILFFPGPDLPWLKDRQRLVQFALSQDQEGIENMPIEFRRDNLVRKVHDQDPFM
jgi:hypothetical protein